MAKLRSKIHFMVFCDLKDDVPKHCGNMPGLADYGIYILHISQNSHVYVKWHSFPFYIDQDSSCIILDHSTKCKNPGKKKNLVNVTLAWFVSWIGIFFYLDIFSCFYYGVKKIVGSGTIGLTFPGEKKGCQSRVHVHNTWFCLANHFAS